MTLEETGEAFHEKGVKKDKKAWACKRLVGRPLAEISGKGPPAPQELEERRHFGSLTQGQGGRTTTSKTPKTIQVPNVIDDTQTLERQIVEDITSWTFPGASIPRPPATCKWYYLICLVTTAEQETLLPGFSMAAISNLYALTWKSMQRGAISWTSHSG